MSNWEKFANQNAEYFILTENPYLPNTDEWYSFFFSSGELETKRLLSRVNNKLNFKGTVCEIGCGVGRLLLPHAKLFNNAVGVDISATMLQKLQLNAGKFEVSNISGFLSAEPWYKIKYAYIYSFIVFQHIEDIKIITDYINKISSALEQNGLAQLQFDTRKINLLYRVRNMLPDFMLPKSQRKGIRRIRIDSDKVRRMFHNSKLIIEAEYDKDTELHTFMLHN